MRLLRYYVAVLLMRFESFRYDYIIKSALEVAVLLMRFSVRIHHVTTHRPNYVAVLLMRFSQTEPHSPLA